MSARKLVILGTGVFAEEVKDLVDDGELLEPSGFVENWSRDVVPGPLRGLPVHWIDDIAPLTRDHVGVCAIGTTNRVGFVSQAENLGLPFTTVVHPSARLSRTSTLGAGAILSVGVIVAAHTRLGRHVIVNRGCLIGHHTRVGEFVTISPGANIGGRVTIGAGSYIGMGAIVLNDITLGEGAVVGAGALVTRDVPDHVMVMGVPAKITKQGVNGL